MKQIKLDSSTQSLLKTAIHELAENKEDEDARYIFVQENINGFISDDESFLIYYDDSSANEIEKDIETLQQISKKLLTN